MTNWMVSALKRQISIYNLTLFELIERKRYGADQQQLATHKHRNVDTIININYETVITLLTFSLYFTESLLLLFPSLFSYITKLTWGYLWMFTCFSWFITRKENFDWAHKQINILTQSITHVWGTNEKKILSTLEENPIMKQINIEK